MVFPLWVIFQIWDKFIPWRFPDVPSMSEFTFSPQPPPYLPKNPVIYFRQLKINQLKLYHNLCWFCISFNETFCCPENKVCYHPIMLSFLQFHTQGFPIFNINEFFDETDTWSSVQFFWHHANIFQEIDVYFILRF